MLATPPPEPPERPPERLRPAGTRQGRPPRSRLRPRFGNCQGAPRAVAKSDSEHSAPLRGPRGVLGGPERAPPPERQARARRRPLAGPVTAQRRDDTCLECGRSRQARAGTPGGPPALRRALHAPGGSWRGSASQRQSAAPSLGRRDVARRAGAGPLRFAAVQQTRRRPAAGGRAEAWAPGLRPAGGVDRAGRRGRGRGPTSSEWR